jgi:flagellar basal-body rod protein FlgB
MFEKPEITRMAQALASHAGARMGVVAGNIANADTPGYKRRDLPDFAKSYAAMQSGDGLKVTRAKHIGAGWQNEMPAPEVQRSEASPDGNSVSLESEMVQAAEIRQQHDMALSVYRASSDILKLALGRGR